MGFTTQRLHIRRLTMDDLEAFHGVWSDPRVIFWGASADLESSRRTLQDLVARRIDGITESGWLAILRAEDGQFVGDVVLEPASWDPSRAEVGWHVASAFQRRGYATEAAGGLLAHAKACGLAEVWAKILPDNAASRRVAVRLKMARAGHLQHAGREHELWKRTLG